MGPTCHTAPVVDPVRARTGPVCRRCSAGHPYPRRRTVSATRLHAGPQASAWGPVTRFAPSRRPNLSSAWPRQKLSRRRDVRTRAAGRPGTEFGCEEPAVRGDSMRLATRSAFATPACVGGRRELSGARLGSHKHLVGAARRRADARRAAWSSGGDATWAAARDGRERSAGNVLSGGLRARAAPRTAMRRLVL